jgi:hypothetical protein
MKRPPGKCCCLSVCLPLLPYALIWLWGYHKSPRSRRVNSKCSTPLLLTQLQLRPEASRHPAVFRARVGPARISPVSCSAGGHLQSCEGPLQQWGVRCQAESSCVLKTDAHPHLAKWSVKYTHFSETEVKPVSLDFIFLKCLNIA